MHLLRHVTTSTVALAALALAIALLLVGLSSGGQAARASSTSDPAEAPVQRASVSTGPFAYVASGSGLVSVIDLTSETEDTAIATGGHPYWVAISADGSTVAASLHHSDGVALIDGTTNTLIGVVGGVGSEPEAVAVNSDGSTVYVADESGDTLFRVDVASQTVTAGPIDLSANCGEPENMVISPDDAFLYVTCGDFSGSFVIRVATAGFGITVVSGGLNDPHGIALNAAGTRLYYTDGTDVFEWNTATEALTGTTFSDCEMYFGSVSPDGSRLYCQEEFGPLNIYATSDGSPLASLSVGGDAVAVSPDNSRAYVPVGSAVEVIDTAALTDLPGNIAMTGSGGRGIAIAPPVQEPETTPTPTPTPTPTVAAATATPTPTPVVLAAALPTTGGTPSDGGSSALPWLAAIAGAIALIGSGSAWLAHQRRRIR